jgi:hypothetical protein
MEPFAGSLIVTFARAAETPPRGTALPTDSRQIALDIHAKNPYNKSE